MASLASYIVSINRLVTKAERGLFSTSEFGSADITAFQDGILKQSWMITIALGANVWGDLLSPACRMLADFVSSYSSAIASSGGVLACYGGTKPYIAPALS